MKTDPNKIDSSITVLIIYGNQTSETYICNPNDKIKDCLTKFAEKIIKMELRSLYFLYGGTQIAKNNLDKSIYDIMNSQDKLERKMSILVYPIDIDISFRPKNLEEISIIFILESNKTKIIKADRDKLMRDIFKDFARNEGLDFNSLMFKYGDKKIEFNEKLKFDNIANSLDKKCLGMTILVYHRTPLTINFIFNNNFKYIMNCFLEDKIREIINKYCIQNNLDINNLLFLYQNNLLNLDNNFLDLNINEPDPNDNDILNINSQEKETKNLEIKVFTKYKQTPQTSNINNDPNNFHNAKNKCLKYFLITLGIILALLIIIIIIIFVVTKKDDENETLETNKVDSTGLIGNPTQNEEDDENETSETNKVDSKGLIDNPTQNEEDDENNCLNYNNTENKCEECNIGYKLIDDKCKPDFFIKAVYETTSDGETIDLIYSTYNLQRVIYMIIDGVKIENPKVIYHQFLEKGNHIVYIKINQYETNWGFFRGLTNLISVTFTDFNDYKPNIRFRVLFSDCIKLTSVDFSQLYYEYSDDLDYMFKGCSSLTYVNINIKTFVVRAYITGMFIDCKSLTSIDLSKLNVSFTSYFDNMFSGCNSLESINLGSFKLEKATQINSMFYNCYSLKYLDLSSFQPIILEEMKSVFYNCTSLTSINLNRFYTSRVRDMNKLFYNCTSLKLIDLSSFDTRQVTYMHNMFQNCHSVTSISFGSNFVTNKVVNLTEIFSGCHSLENIGFDITITTSNLYFENSFSDCYSLKSINFLSLSLNKYTNLKGMFSGCYSLTSIDLSNAIFPEGTTSLLSLGRIFYDCPNLDYIKFFKFDDSRDYNLFNKNISSSGTLILTENYHTLLNNRENEDNPPSSWTIVHY